MASGCCQALDIVEILADGYVLLETGSLVLLLPGRTLGLDPVSSRSYKHAGYGGAIVESSPSVM